MTKVNPTILSWARETAGMSLEAAARAIDLKEARGVAGADRLAALERGDGEPTRPLLVRMAHKYHRPLLVFYLAHPPVKGDRGQDFRTLSGAPSPDYDPQLDALIRDVRVRQGLVKSLVEDDDPQPLPFIASQTMESTAEAVAKSICETVGFDIRKFRAARTAGAAFAYLRSTIEAHGIFVLLIGNLGSHHSNIGAKTFRGFAIADPVAPFIVINDQDASAAWSFTALHEVAHLWLGTSGVSGSSAEAKIERFCNDVAGRILLPSHELSSLADLSSVSLADAIERISEFASERNISRRMVAYQLMRFSTIDSQRYTELTDHFYGDWIASRARSKEAAGDDAGAPSFYVVRRHRLGQALIGLVTRSLNEGVLTYSKAAQLLGVKLRTVEPLLREVQARGDA